MGVMAMFGKLRMLKVKLSNEKDKQCGKFKIGKDCQCSKKIWIAKLWSGFKALLGLIILLFAGDILVRGAVNFSLRIKIPALSFR